MFFNFKDSKKNNLSVTYDAVMQKMNSKEINEILEEYHKEFESYKNGEFKSFLLDLIKPLTKDKVEQALQDLDVSALWDEQKFQRFSEIISSEIIKSESLSDQEKSFFNNKLGEMLKKDLIKSMENKYGYVEDVVTFKKTIIAAENIYAEIKEKGASPDLVEQLKNLMFSLMNVRYFTALIGKYKENGDDLNQILVQAQSVRKKCLADSIELFSNDINSEFIDPKTARSNTILIEIATGFTDLVLPAFEHGADPNLQTSAGYGNTPLVWSVANASNETAIKLIEEGLKLTGNLKINLDLPSKYFGNTALILSVAKGHNDPSTKKSITNHVLTEVLLENGAKPNIPDEHGNTALHIACVRRDKKSIELLLQHGADLRITNNNGKTPLDMLSMSYREADEFIMLQTGNSRGEKCYTLNAKSFIETNVKELAEMLTSKKPKQHI